MERGKLVVVECPRPVGTLFGVLDGNEAHRTDEAVGTHGIDDVLRVGPGAWIVVDLRADRKPHAAAQRVRNDVRVRHVDPGGFGRAVKVAGCASLSARRNVLTAPGSSNVR